MRLASALGVRAGERRTVALLATLMFVTLAGATVGESAVNALFFERIGAKALPSMYLAQAGSTLVAMFVLTAVLQRVTHRAVYLWSPLLLAAVVLAERGVLTTSARWIYPVLWMTVAFATLAQAIGLWGTAGVAVDTHQAKRLFPIFGAGGILGAVLGGLLTRPLAAALGVENLLLVWIVALVAAAMLVRLSLGRSGGAAVHVGRHAPVLESVRSGYAYVRRSRLLTAMAIASVLFSILFYSLFLPFATAATERFADADGLAGFFGLVGASITGGAFLMSILLTNRLFGRFGVTAMMLVLPLLYLGAFGILLVGVGFAVIVALKITTGVWLQGVASPGWETLVNVVPDDRRDETRAFLNGGPSQVGTAIAGLVALVGQDALTARQFAAIGIVASLLTVAVVLVIRRSYLDALVGALLSARPQVFEKATAWTQVPLDVDAASVQVLADAMRSDDVRTRRFAFQLAAGLHATGLSDALREGLRDRDPLVRLSAVGSVNASTDDGRDALLAMIDDGDPAVAAAASARSLGNDRADARLEELLTDHDGAVRLAAVEQLRMAGSAAVALAQRSLADPDPLVEAAALDLLASTAPERALPLAVARLRAADLVVRTAAGRALGTIGSSATTHVLDALRDPETRPAAVEAARRIEPDGHAGAVKAFVAGAADRASSDRALIASTPTDADLEALLHVAILDRAQAGARAALWAANMVAIDRAAHGSAIERLDAAGPVRASALETLEAADGTKSLGPLLALWEPIGVTHDRDGGWLTTALEDDDDLVRRCAEVIRARREGDTMAPSPHTVSVVERVLVLRTIPLFADLSPTDLERLALIAEERGYDDGETIAREGEVGDAMHIVTDGVIRVVSDEDGHVIARRTAGDVVGEMSIITRNPRIASLVADGPVRTIMIGQREFESMVRERPDLALGIIRVLALRLEESARSTSAEAGST